MLALRQFCSLASITLLANGCILFAPDQDSPRTIAAPSDASDVSEAASDDASTADADVQAVGAGALCGVNGRNDCGPFMICDGVLGCVECAEHGDCPLAAPVCVSGSCAACHTTAELVEEDAGDTRGRCEPSSACWPIDHECHPRCANSLDCPSIAPTCDVASGECWGCRMDGDCPSGICSPLTKQCVECTHDAHCPGERPRCRGNTGTCAECTSNADCGHAAPICDPKTLQCRVGCSGPEHCPGQRCDVTTATCVANEGDSGIADATTAEAGE